MFKSLLIGLKVKVKYDHKYLGLNKGNIGEIVEICDNPKYSPNVYVKFRKIKRIIGFLADEIERVK